MHALEEYDAVRHESLVPPDVFNTDEPKIGGEAVAARQRLRVSVVGVRGVVSCRCCGVPLRTGGTVGANAECEIG